MSYDDARPWHHRCKAQRALPLAEPWALAVELAYALGDAFGPSGLKAISNPEWRGPRAPVGPVAAWLLRDMRVGLYVRGADPQAPTRVLLLEHDAGIDQRVEGGTIHVRLWSAVPVTVIATFAAAGDFAHHEDEAPSELAFANVVRRLTVPLEVNGRVHVTIDIGGGAGVPPQDPTP